MVIFGYDTFTGLMTKSTLSKVCLTHSQHSSEQFKLSSRLQR